MTLLPNRVRTVEMRSKPALSLAPRYDPTPLALRTGSIVELDWSHLPVALKLPPERRKYAAKITEIWADPDNPGWSIATAHSTKAMCTVTWAVPPIGEKYEGGRGPKTRVIRY